jgi:hypothetical protein
VKQDGARLKIKLPILSMLHWENWSLFGSVPSEAVANLQIKVRKTSKI